MTLVPTDSIVGAVASLEDADPQAARMLVQLGLFESLMDQIEAVRQPMTEQVIKNIAAINASTRRQIERYGVSKGDAPQQYVHSLELVEKGLAGDLVGAALSFFNRNHPRDDHGRFITRNLTSDTDPNLPAEAKLTSQFTDATHYIDKLKQGGLINDKTKVSVELGQLDHQTGRVGDTRSRMQVSAGTLAQELGPVIARGYIPMTVKVHRRDLNNMSPEQLASVDLAALTMQESYPNAHAMTRNLFDSNHKLKRNGEQIAGQWYGETQGTNRQSYRRIKATGEALSHFSAPGSAGSFAGGIAQLMGELGPEAETVLGPGIRRTAYRYRGTERRPDRVLWESVERATKYADLLADPRSHMQARQLIASANAEKRPSDYAALIAARHTHSRSEDQRDLQVRGAAAIGSLLGVGHAGERKATRLPDLELAELSLESGEMPPSEGVIIDARGRVVTQAVGYNGDHYLPFDLRNLGALAGGQYVRTRATGGPTTEDIYTGLVTGARQLQVVSNSGVFTLEFDPDLRGVRRFNDKVSRMVERYGSLLETIHSNAGTGRFYENDLPEEEKQKINQQAAQAAGGDEDKFKTNRDKLLAQARFNSRNNRETQAEIEEYAYNQAEARVDQRFASTREKPSKQQRAREIEDEASKIIQNRDPGVRELKLNGEGYHRALRALKQEFPYYIRTATFQSLPEWLAERNLPTMGYKRKSRKEMGYVEQGQTNTKQARKGGFRTARYVPTGRSQETATATPDAAATAQGATTAQGQGAQTTGGVTNAQRPNAPDVPALVASQMARSVNPLISMFRSIPPPLDYPDSRMPLSEVMTQYPAQTYLHRVVADKVGNVAPGEEGRAFAKWFTGASPQERARAVEGFNEFAKDPEAKDLDTGRIKTLIDETVSHLELLEPFTIPEEGAPKWSVRPDLGKPADYGDAPKWDADAGEWDRAEAQMAIDYGDDFVSGVFATLKSKTPEKQRQDVATLYADYENAKNAGNDIAEPQRELDEAQRAWSFLHAKRIAARLHQLVGSDAGPKVPELDVNKAQRLVYDPPAQDFLLDLRNQIDDLLSHR